MNLEEIEKQISSISIIERLDKCDAIIGNICATGRNFKMSIPAQYDDEDLFVTQTIRDAKEEVKRLKKENERLKEALVEISEIYPETHEDASDMKEIAVATLKGY